MNTLLIEFGVLLRFFWPVIAVVILYYIFYKRSIEKIDIINPTKNENLSINNIDIEESLFLYLFKIYKKKFFNQFTLFISILLIALAIAFLMIISGTNSTSHSGYELMGEAVIVFPIAFFIIIFIVSILVKFINHVFDYYKINFGIKGRTFFIIFTIILVISIPVYFTLTGDIDLRYGLGLR